MECRGINKMNKMNKINKINKISRRFFWEQSRHTGCLGLCTPPFSCLPAWDGNGSQKYKKTKKQKLLPFFLSFFLCPPPPPKTKTTTTKWKSPHSKSLSLSLS